MRRLLISAFLLSPLTCAAGTVYECLDAGGRITFSDTGCPAQGDPRRTRIDLEEGRRASRTEGTLAPDAGAGLREGERHMLEMIRRDEQIQRIQKQDERRAFLREHRSYGERVERRNTEMQRRNARER